MTRGSDSSVGAAVRAGIDDLIAEIDDGLNMLSNGGDVDLSGFDFTFVLHEVGKNASIECSEISGLEHTLSGKVELVFPEF